MKQRNVLTLLLLILLLTPLSAQAARKIKVKDPSRITTVAFGSGTIFCLDNKTPGTPLKNNTLFKPDSNKISNLKKKKRKAASKGKKKKLGQKIKNEKALLDTKKEACANGGGTPPPTPTPVPTPGPKTPENESLESVGTMDATQIAYLIEKAGFGIGPNDSYLLGLAGESAEAVVAEFVRDKSEDAAMISRVFNRLDDDINNQGFDNFPTLQGIQRALLDLTVNTSNSYRWRLTYMLLRVANVDCGRLSTAGSNTPGANPNQLPLCWAYILFTRSEANNLQLVNYLKDLVENEAFLIASGNAGNDQNRPQEGFARDLLDRLLVGPRRVNSQGGYLNNYTQNVALSGNQESDIARIARRGTGLDVALFETAVTGIFDWFMFTDSQNHNDGPETIFEGTSQAFSAEDLDDVIEGTAASHPGFHVHWSRLVLEEFVSPNPPQNLVNNFAVLLKNNGNNLEASLNILLASKAFHHANYKDTVAKNPLEQLVSFIRTMGMVPVVNRTDQNNVNTIATTYLTNGMGWSITNNPGVPRSRWTDATTTTESLRYMAAITNLAFQTEGLIPPLWLRTNVLPSGERTEDQMIADALSRFGTTLSSEQVTFFRFFMTFVLNSGFVPYDNEDNAAQGTKGIRLQLMSAGLPGFRLK